MVTKAVIFDLDGTLLNTLEDIADAINEVLSGLGFPTHDIETYKTFVGEGVENLMLRVLPEGHRDEKMILRCVKLIRGQYEIHAFTKTKIYDGIPDLLDDLTRRGITLAVLSNKPHENAAPQVEYYLGAGRFEVVQGALPDVPNKPDPTGALSIAERMGVEPQECIFIGDSDIDMITAVNAGMYPVGATWGFRSAEELEANGAKVLLKKPVDLLAIV